MKRVCLGFALGAAAAVAFTIYSSPRVGGWLWWLFGNGEA